MILEGGWSATSLGWNSVPTQVARRQRVCAYDRAGSGYSDPGPEPRDGAAIAKDLDDAIRAARLPGPFILVGHSAGALYVRLLANLRPHDIAGLVLVDPTIEHQDRRAEAVFGADAGSLAGLHQRAETCLAAAEAGELPSADPRLAVCVPTSDPALPPSVNAVRLAEARRPSTWRTRISELDNLLTTTSDEITRGPSAYGAMPMVVLTAVAAAPASTQTLSPGDAFRISLHRELAARSRRGTQAVVYGSSHLMMRDRPDAIVSAIEVIDAQADGRRGPSVSRPQDETRR